MVSSIEELFSVLKAWLNRNYELLVDMRFPDYL